MSSKKQLHYRAKAMSLRLMMAVVAVTILTGVGRATEPASGWRLCPSIFTLHPPCMMCPDDYCCKPMPCLAPFKYCGPDDYCCKPMPCLAPVKYCGPDDYCCKPMPAILPLCPTPLYTCGPPPTCNCPNIGCHQEQVAPVSTPVGDNHPPPGR